MTTRQPKFNTITLNEINIKILLNKIKDYTTYLELPYENTEWSCFVRNLKLNNLNNTPINIIHKFILKHKNLVDKYVDLYKKDVDNIVRFIQLMYRGTYLNQSKNKCELPAILKLPKYNKQNCPTIEDGKKKYKRRYLTKEQKYEEQRQRYDDCFTSYRNKLRLLSKKLFIEYVKRFREDLKEVEQIYNNKKNELNTTNKVNRREHANEKINCPICNQIITRSNLSRHQKNNAYCLQIQQERKQELEERKQEEQKLKQEKPKTHRQEHANEKINCPICDALVTRSNLSRHKKTNKKCIALQQEQL